MSSSLKANWLLKLRVGARACIAVQPPEVELRGVAKPIALQVVIAHLDHLLGAQRDEREIFAGASTRGFVLAGVRLPASWAPHDITDEKGTHFLREQTISAAAGGTAAAAPSEVRAPMCAQRTGHRVFTGNHQLAPRCRAGRTCRLASIHR